MSDDRLAGLQDRYTEALLSYVQTHSESALFTISKLSKEFMGQGLGPDDITNMHSVAMGRIVSELTGDAVLHAFQRSTEPLLEIMMNYAMLYHGHVAQYKKQLAEYEGGEKNREQERLASVGMLLLGVNAELLNQMEAIIGYAEAKGPGAALSDKQLSQLILSETARSKEKLKTAILYSWKLSCRTDEKTPVNLNDLLIESIDVVRNSVRLDGVIIQTNYKTLVKVTVNPVEMQQALVNLIASAIDAMQGSGQLMISTGIEQNGGRENIALSIVSVQNGAARRADTFRLPASKVNVGAAIAASIIKRLGGTVDLENGDRGLKATIRLPVTSKVNDFVGSVATRSGNSL